MGRAADVHVFDEADFGADLPAIFEQVQHLVIIETAENDRIQLQRRETGGASGVDAGQHARQDIRAGQGPAGVRAAVCRG